MPEPDDKNIERALEPCPFCGSPAKLEKQRFAYPPRSWAKCTYCGSGTTDYSTPSSAIAAWNTRAHARTLQQHEAQVEERKFYRSNWPPSSLLEARNKGLLTDDGEAWRYRYSHKDAKGEYDVLYRPATEPQHEAQGQGEPVAAIVKDVCELPGDNDPDADDTLILSVDDLRVILERHLAAPPTKPQQQPQDWLTEELGQILAFADQSNVNEYARCPECSDIETVARAALEKLREAGHG